MTTTTVQCTIDGCEWSCEGMRDLPDMERAPMISAALGVSTTFFISDWIVKEGLRIEDEIAEHMKSHTMLEALITIQRLNIDRDNLTRDLEHYKNQECKRICCTSR